jgi:hypothetical protein
MPVILARYAEEYGIEVKNACLDWLLPVRAEVVGRLTNGHSGEAPTTVRLAGPGRRRNVHFSPQR